MINIFYTLLYRISDQVKKPSTGTLKIKLNNLPVAKGVINVSFHHDSWEQITRNEIFPFACIVDNTLVIDDLPYGEYAIRVFHDENCNGIQDMNHFGYSKEAIGYSGESQGYDQAPAPANSMVAVTAKDQEIEIKMRVR